MYTVNNNNEDQSNLAKGGIIRLHSPGGSIRLTVWLQFAVTWFGWGLTPKSPLSLGVREPHVTQCHWALQYVPAKWHLNLLNSLSSDRQTTDNAIHLLSHYYYYY